VILKGSIDVTSIDKARLVLGKTVKKNGKLGQYLNIAIIECAGNYGQTHIIVEDVTKEERLAGKRGTVIGTIKAPPGARASSPAPQRAPAGDEY
jgi:hypothetical protein